jgi:hypothetical protein
VYCCCCCCCLFTSLPCRGLFTTTRPLNTTTLTARKMLCLIKFEGRKFDRSIICFVLCTYCFGERKAYLTVGRAIMINYAKLRGSNGSVCRCSGWVCDRTLCCKLISKSKTAHSPTNALFIKLGRFKLYTRIHINIAPTRFGLRLRSCAAHNIHATPKTCCHTTT